MSQDYRKRAEELVNRYLNGVPGLTSYAAREIMYDEIESVLKLVAQEARREENEACWNLAMGATGDTNNVAFAEGYSGACRDIAKAIRSRLGDK